ncbi:MAG: SIS domain-containing protein [Actinomycetota bacterium]|nr:SIS domain-containing protein [Actinomycetota bacterium]
MSGRQHLDDLDIALRSLRGELDRLDRWGRHVARRLDAGGRLLAVGNGGSAAQAQHLTAELVGRYRQERRPLSAIALHAETSTTTALTNDYGADAVFARQVVAHGRPEDVLVALSTSGRSTNVLEAVRSAHDVGLLVLALTGPAPNPLASTAHDALSVDAETPTVQEVHQVAVHLLCEAIDAVLLGPDTAPHGARPLVNGARS